MCGFLPSPDLGDTERTATRVAQGKRSDTGLAALAAEDADGVGGVAGIACHAAAVGAGGRLGAFFERGAFTGSEEEIRLDGMLLGVEVVVAAALSVESLVRTTLDDAACFDDEDLIGAADGREPVRDDKCCASAHQVLQAFLNQRLGFRV